MSREGRLDYLKKIDDDPDERLRLGEARGGAGRPMPIPRPRLNISRASQAWDSTHQARVDGRTVESRPRVAIRTPGSRSCLIGRLAPQPAKRLKNEVSFHRGFWSRLATRSRSLATRASNAPAACLSTGCLRSSEGAW